MIRLSVSGESVHVSEYQIGVGISNTIMERFPGTLWIYWICALHIAFLCEKIVRADQSVNSRVYLNISVSYIDVKVNDIIYIKCSGRQPLKWEYKHPLGSPDTYFSKEVFDSADESIIRLTFHHEEATGRYICENNSSQASVFIFVNGDQLIVSDQLLTIFNGYIHCIPTASNVNMTLWKKYSRGSTRIQIDTEFDPTRGFLAIPQPDFYNGYMFECEAQLGDKIQTLDEMVLDYLPETTTVPTVSINSSNATYVMAGSSFSLKCSVQTDAFAFLYVTWTYPKQRVGPNASKEESHSKDETHFFLNSTLSILNATENNTGTYICTAVDHSQKSNFAQVNVTVYETAPPTVLTFLGGSEEVIADKGKNVELVARYTVFPPTPNIQTKWTKDDQPIISKFKHTARQAPSLLTLEISGLNGKDSGIYTVTANASGYIEEKSFLLLVKDKPFVDVSLDGSRCFPPGHKSNITCEAKGYPLANIFWSWKPVCLDTKPCNVWTPFEESYQVNNSTVITETERIRSISYLSVVAEQSGFYKCKAQNQMGVAEREILFVVADAEDGFQVTYSSTNEKEGTPPICKASLVLYSGVEWKRVTLMPNESRLLSSARQAISKTPFSLQTELIESIESPEEKYVCFATLRKTGEVEEKHLDLFIQDLMVIPNESPGMKMDILLILIFVGIFVAIITTVCIVKFRSKRKKQKIALAELSNHPFAEGKLGLFDSNLPLDEQVDLLPYDETWEFPREKLKLGRTLGQGAFGRVVKAEAFEMTEDGASTTVAVKMLKERTDRNQQKSLMDELKILIHLGHHVNIVNLMGAVTKNCRKEGIMVIVEYCRYGNIRHYLQRNRESFINEIDRQSGKVISTGELVFSDYEISHDPYSELLHNSSSSSSGVFSVHNPNYRRIRGKNVICTDPRGSFSSHIHHLGSFSSSTGSFSRSDSQDIVVTTSDLICFAFQCSQGMVYLASKKLIHRDLAARNILLAEDKIVKICDFGLAKDCYKYSNYIKKGDGPLPIKWMSIESIWDHVFTTKSDVWSFGIFMWELFTLGGNPYPGLDIDEHFYKKLKSGYRMEKPELCPTFAYEIMRECWNTNPDMRPHFSQISERLGNSLDQSIKQHYIDVNEPYMEMNKKLKSPFYSNVERLDIEEAVRPYVNSKVQDTAPEYDVPRARSILDESVPSEPMEVVPMIQLESTCQWHQEAPSLKQETTDLPNTETLDGPCNLPNVSSDKMT